ncbi:MAG: hypothetical protein ABSD38_17735 [Syntrophorhabdales bacterium]
MKKLIALAIIMAVMVLVAALAHAQSPANDVKPTFISPTPGLYVNGWPAFTVTYPKEWVEITVQGGAVFSAGVSQQHLPNLAIDVTPNPLPLEEWAKIYMPVFLQLGTDIKVLSDKPSQLKDGTRTREIELEFVLKNGPKVNHFILMTKKDVIWVAIILAADEGKLGEDLKKIAYSLTFLQGREEPVNVPPDVRTFFDMWGTDAVSHDLKTVMAHFSDRFRHSGMSKAFLEQVFRDPQFPLSPARQSLISCATTVTVFEPRGDKAYVDGFILNIDKVKGEATDTKIPILFQQIINEHGEWKWFGNQK